MKEKPHFPKSFNSEKNKSKKKHISKKRVPIISLQHSKTKLEPVEFPNSWF